MNKCLVIGIVGAFAASFSFAAFAQSPATQQVGTAHVHALMAQGATTVPSAHTHLHHVINCLVGPEGSGFDEAAGNPCKGQGNGALKDSASDAALQAKLNMALADAQSGLASDTLSTVQGDAAKAAAALADTPAKKASGAYSW